MDMSKNTAVKKTAVKEVEKKTVQITAPAFESAIFTIVGTAPYVQNKFSNKAKEMMRQKHIAGSAAKKGVKREPRDFDEDYRQATYFSTDGWMGIPASGFRLASISACRLVGFKMTLAKLSIFVEQDGFTADGEPLIKIEGEPVKHEAMVRNATGVADIRVRPMWHKWSAKVRIRWDADQFSEEDVLNLMARVGAQVGIGEGRPDSKASAGMGWGTFAITEVERV